MGAVLLIKPSIYAEISSDPNFPALIAEYAAECSIPEIGAVNPQSALYLLMESTGMLKEYAVYENGQMIGFIFIQAFVLPHYGSKIANVESLFVAKAHRKSGIGFEMLRTARAHAKAEGCVTILYNAPAGSDFERLLSARKQCRRSNSVFCEAL